MKTLPFKYKNITPEDRYLLQSKNPPKVKIEFYENIKNLTNINCFSNEEINGEIQLHLLRKVTSWKLISQKNLLGNVEELIVL